MLVQQALSRQGYPPGSIKSYYFHNEEPLKEHVTFHGQVESN